MMTDIDALFTFIFLLLFACVPAKIASSKGRDFLLWYVYGFFLFIFALIHSIVIDADNKAIESKKLNTREFKKCPHCAELIRKEATICRFCHSQMPAPDPVTIAPAPPKAPPKTEEEIRAENEAYSKELLISIGWVLGLILIIIFFWAKSR